MLPTATRTMAFTFAAAAVKKTSDSKPNPAQNAEQDNSLVCKPSELPIYGSLRKKPSAPCHKEVKDSTLHHNVEEGVRYVRKELQSGYNVVADQAGVITDYLETAKLHTQRSIDYLNEPQNSLHRSGAIVMGGLAGFIFAARGGFIKKVVYTGIGAGAVASLCYPRQAEENCRVVLYEGRKIFAVAYNFIKGVKPGEEVPIEPLKKFPTSLEDLKYLALDLVDEAKDTLFPKKK
ncbi:MICOS complex subunit Mic26 [Scaptodrosophila lebanonensis]|uniref:MICOS complex subunit n=1 Tax=Drosophila lebanonensis TaxID=7225 RepID=A0A6J2TIH6_DROLE|nr:MICOS complex subunit Mic26 [Scaptodrosophila lebanonensis]